MRRLLAALPTRRNAVLAGTAAACAVQMPDGVHWLPRTLAGLWLLLGAPVALWRGTAAKVAADRSGSLLISIGFAVLTTILVALAVNTALPHFGYDRPLTRVTLAGGQAMVLTLLGAFLPEAERDGPPLLERAWPRGLLPVAGLGALAVVLSVAGAIRLNNGYSGAVSGASLVVVAALLVLLLVRREEYPPGVAETGLYAAGAALLLLTSLRGWYITGHDIQHEYEFYRLALGAEYWNITAYPDPYNACLSITLLPVSLVKLTAIPELYVFKAVLPLLFAFTPVLVHRTVRHVAPPLVALLSVVFFMVFPTFFTDMPFLGRQQIAFLFLGCAMLVLTDSARPLVGRRIAFTVLIAGSVLAHYSTVYVIVATLGVAWTTDLLWRLFTPKRGTRFRTRNFISWWMVLVPAVAALAWAGPITDTGGQLRKTVDTVVADLLEPGESSGGSSDTSYSLFGGDRVSPKERLAEYRAENLEHTARERAEGVYLPEKTVAPYHPEPAEQDDLPLTAAGRALDSAGVSVSGVNTALRQGAALLLQVLVLAGLAVAVFARGSRAFHPLRDQLTLTVGALGVTALFVALPQLSVDYSLLRAFQQGMFVFAPFMAAGCLWLLRWAGRRTVPLVCALAAGLALDLTGVVPKALGGYPAQLQLDNAGRYYDIYYPHAEERQAVFWLERQIAANSRAEALQTDRYTHGRLQTLITGFAQPDIYPTALRSDSYVLLGEATVRRDEVTIFYRGDLITYRYPTEVLKRTKNLIYSSEGAAIYR